MVFEVTYRIRSQWDEHNLPVSRVEGNSVDLDEDIIVPHSRKRDFLNLGLAHADVLDGLHGLG